MANQGVQITISGATKPVLLRGPIPAVVTVRNASAAPVEVLLPYPNPNHLSFDCPTAKRKEVQPASERTIPIDVAPGATYTATYFLNRYLAFDAPGQARVSYHLDAFVTAGGAGADQVAQGQLVVDLIEGTKAALEEELSNHAVGLKSKDRQKKAEAAEALAFLETPLALEYQARMLGIENLETMGIQALGRSSSPQAQQLIVGMLTHRESGVVGAALAEIDRLHLALPREKVWPLLVSDNPSIRWTAVDWMAAHPDPRDRAHVTPLLSDPNPGVRDRAKAYLATLPAAPGAP
jgi:hypothetical protein